MTAPFREEVLNVELARQLSQRAIVSEPETIDQTDESEDVKGKRDAARRWANYVTADERVEAVWRYLLVSETDVDTATTGSTRRELVVGSSSLARIGSCKRELEATERRALVP